MSLFRKQGTIVKPITSRKCPPGEHKHPGIQDCHPAPPAPGSWHKDPKVRHTNGTDLARVKRIILVGEDLKRFLDVPGLVKNRKRRAMMSLILRGILHDAKKVSREWLEEAEKLIEHYRRKEKRQGRKEERQEKEVVDVENIEDLDRLWRKENVQKMEYVEEVGGIPGVYGDVTSVVTFNNGARAIYKRNEYAVNTALVYKFAKDVFGTDIVPFTDVRNLGRGVGSVSRWIEGKYFWDADHRFKIDEDLRKDYLRMRMLDQIIKNYDRHERNFMLGKSGKLYAIDNDWGFTGKGHFKNETSIEGDEYLYSDAFTEKDFKDALDFLESKKEVILRFVSENNIGAISLGEYSVDVAAKEIAQTRIQLMGHILRQEKRE